MRGTSWLASGVTILALLAMSVPQASAAPPQQAPMLAFEISVGEPSAASRKHLDQLADLLETHGFVAREDAFLRLLGGRAPRPGNVDANITAGDIAKRVNAGVHAYVRGKFDEARTTLSDVIEQIHRNPEILVIDTQNSELTVRAYMALALAQSRLEQAAASAATLMELVRITRGQPISRSEFGPEADKMYRAVLKHAQTLGRGSLTITTGDDTAMIFVDGSLRGMGKATLGDLFPGVYRVYVQAPDERGRRYAIEVKADEEHVLGVKYEIEKALWITDSAVGFRLASDVERKHEVRYATELARTWAGEGIVAVFGESVLNEKPVISGTLYRTDGSVVRSASIEAAGVERDRLRSLAKFIADGTPGDGLDIRGERIEVASRPGTSAPSSGAALAPKHSADRPPSVDVRWVAVAVEINGRAGPRFDVGREPMREGGELGLITAMHARPRVAVPQLGLSVVTAGHQHPDQARKIVCSGAECVWGERSAQVGGIERRPNLEQRLTLAKAKPSSADPVALIRGRVAAHPLGVSHALEQRSIGCQGRPEIPNENDLIGDDLVPVCVTAHEQRLPEPQRRALEPETDVVCARRAVVDVLVVTSKIGIEVHATERRRLRPSIQMLG